MSKKWEEVKIKHLYNLTNGGTPKSDEPTYWEPKEIEWVTPEDLSTPGKKVNTVKRKISKLGLANSSATLINRNSVAISTRAPIGNPKLILFQYSTNQGCKSMSPKQKSNSSPDYLYYFLSASEGELKNLGRGTTFLELSNFALRNFKILNPSIEEQNCIVKFLDVKTSEIDTLIEDKEKLIALLEEKRQAIITEAVTKGLNPNVKMKDSGVEWIGEIPEHWDIEKMKYLFKIKKRIEGLENPNILSVTQRGVKVKDISSNEGQLATSYDKYQTVEIGDFVMNHMDLLTGFIDISKFHGVTSPDYRVFSIKKPKFVKQYFLYYFQMNYSRRIFYKFGQGVANFGRWRLPTDEFYNFYVPVPPAEEQKEIVEHISGRLLDIESVIEKTKETIGKLKEYRQSLIYEAVTGKIDVQEMLEETEQEEVSLL